MHANILHAFEEFERKLETFDTYEIDTYEKRTLPLRVIIDTTLIQLPLHQKIQNIQEIISYIEGRSHVLDNLTGAFKDRYRDLLFKLIDDQMTSSEFNNYDKLISNFEKHISKVISGAGKGKSKAAREFMRSYAWKKGEEPDLNPADYIRKLAFVGNIDSAYRWMDAYDDEEKKLLDGQ